MKIKLLKLAFIFPIIFLGGTGSVLVFASKFYGLFLLLASLMVYFSYRKFFAGTEIAKQELIALLKSLVIPLIGIISAIIIGAVILLLTGYDVVAAYRALFYGGFIKNWHISILNATPLIFTGLSVAFAFKAGLFNIGAEGQFYMGSMAALFFGIYLDLPPVLSICLIFILSGIIAAFYNLIPAFLKVKTGAHEVITTMMFAHIARYLSSIFIRNMGGSSSGPHAYVTDPILKSNWLLKFRDFIPGANYRLHIGIIIAIIVAIAVYHILYKTKVGYEIRAVGQNKDAARNQGISVGRNIFIAMLVAGFLAGLAGVTQVIGLDHKMFENLNAGYGWNGISVALLASNHPIGVIFTSLLWGALDSGGQYMSRTLQMPSSIIEIIKGIILFLIVAKYIYSYLGNKFLKKKASGGES